MSWLQLAYATAGLVFVTMTALLSASPLQSQSAVAAVYLESQTCYGRSNCSLHTLQCGDGQRLAILQAAYGFQPKDIHETCQNTTPDSCPQHCCSYNATRDCKQDFSTEDLMLLYNACSNSQSCQIWAQRGNNGHCSTSTRASTSTYSIIKAVCVPEAAIVDPCTNTTVTSELVSLRFQRYPHHNGSCKCRIDTNSTNNNSNVQVLAYDVRASPEGDWKMEVSSAEGMVVMNYSRGVTKFPAESKTISLSSFPLFVTFTLPDLSDNLQHLWLGFQGLPTLLTLRCGMDFEHNETASSRQFLPQQIIVREIVAATATASARSRQDVIGNNNIERVTTTNMPTMRPTKPAAGSKSHRNPNVQETITSERVSLKSDSEPYYLPANTDLSTEEDFRKARTDIIVYVAVGIAGLLTLAFMYVCFQNIRKKGCPIWCPSPCHSLQCGKVEDDERGKVQECISTSSHYIFHDKDVRDSDGKVTEGLQINGHVVFGEESDNGYCPGWHRRSAFDHKRHCGSIHSLRLSSFGSLENIAESEEEGKFPTHHNHSQLNLEEQLQIFKMVESKLAPLATDLVGEEKKDAADDSDDVFIISIDNEKGKKASSHVIDNSDRDEERQMKANVGSPVVANGAESTISQPHNTRHPVVFQVIGGPENLCSDQDKDYSITKL